MHDIRWIRDNAAAFDAGLAKRGLEPMSGEVLAADEKRRAVLTRLQDLQNRRNAASKEIGKAKGAGDEAGAQKLIDEVAGLRDEVQTGEEEAKRLDKALDDLLAAIPNIPADDVPDGPDEDSNVERENRRFGTPPEFAFEPRHHFELGEAAGLMDFETAAKLSGSRYVVLKGAMARLERALAQFMLDLQTGENGYTEVNPPLIVRDEVMYATAQLPKFRSDQYTANKEIGEIPFDRGVLDSGGFEITGTPTLVEKKVLDEAEKLGALPRPIQTRTSDNWGPVRWRFESRQWLIPTAEVPLTNLVRESILSESDLPLRYTAFTPCFRAEAGAAGRDTRGMIRQHQFEKVELVSITTPEQSPDEHERMLGCAEEVLKRLDLPFRVMALSAGDMGFAARKTYDIEVWLPGQGAYREISSCSNCGDFQARRMNARYRPEGEKGPRFVHTLNGSGLAVGRCLVAVLENYQDEGGAVRVPGALKPYMGGIETIEPLDKSA